MCSVTWKELPARLSRLALVSGESWLEGSEASLGIVSRLAIGLLALFDSEEKHLVPVPGEVEGGEGGEVVNAGGRQAVGGDHQGGSM